MNYKNELNEKQYEAVTSNDQYLRIIAGAGSGKTRVLSGASLKPIAIPLSSISTQLVRKMRSLFLISMPAPSASIQPRIFFGGEDIPSKKIGRAHV